MRIIVTGGSGFLGTNLIEHFLANGVETLNLDSVPPRNNEHAPCWRDVDLLDAKKVRDVV